MSMVLWPVFIWPRGKNAFYIFKGLIGVEENMQNNNNNTTCGLQSLKYLTGPLQKKSANSWGCIMENLEGEEELRLGIGWFLGRGVGYLTKIEFNSKR